MRFITFLLFCAMVTLTRAQSVKSYTVEYWNGAGWDSTMRGTFTYNNDFYQIGSLAEMYNGTWVNSFKQTHTIDGDGNPTWTLAEQWNTSAQTWTNSNRTQNTYSLGNQVLSLSQSWNGSAWINQAQSIYVYDATGALASVSSKIWNNNAWVNTARNSYTYNANGSLSTLLYETWNNNQWEYVSKSDYVYIQGVLDYEIQKAWVLSSWQNQNKTSYVYNSNQFLIYSLYEYWNNNAWTTAANSTHSVDSRGNPTLTVSQSWSSSNTWVNSVRMRFDFINTPPLVKTLSVSAVQATSAKVNGNVLMDGGANIQSRGMCFDTSPAPTITNAVQPATAAQGTFACDLNGLSPGQTYYVRAYATNTVGTRYGNELSFTTEGMNSLLEPETKSNLLIFPNPAKDVINIISSSANLILIFDQQGKVVQNKTCAPGSNQIDISGLSEGTYFISSGAGTSRTFVKQ